jgi:hypothetical protein
VKKAVRAPPALIAQVGEGAPAKRFDPGGAVIVHGPAVKVPAAKVPVTLTGPVPVGPLNGETVSVSGVPFVKVAVASSAPAVVPATVTV